MRGFTQLFIALDQTTSTSEKVELMAQYLGTCPAADAAWATFFLTGRRLKRLVAWAAIGEWTLAPTGLERVMLEECWAVVGDGAEAAALLLDQVPAIHATPLSLDQWLQERIL